ncbi:MAG: Gfo/Idh/MocA family oxidoreductase [Natronomonas sp.]|uniref:Gfo/Idh/MocA family protein n=1 Tax=Natronomonas sp. TaxID=2184060 RepID=UPI0028704EC5|nr:Gfo/Idh/MocA family oxidoreductase [Natronomonas sp.]MDR9430521.1 Gfo/Idh/MocA family oxidoreductase [Natronomonas sp.]
MTDDDDEYGLAERTDLDEMAPPALPYRPPEPDAYEPTIGLVGTGGISEQHLSAYRDAGWAVAVLCNRTLEKAEDRRDEFYPDADVTAEYEDVLARDDVDVVDVTTHPDQRVPIMEDAIAAGKHVLSQKPFVEDLGVGERLVERAAEEDVKLAVNQNGRWAPHLGYIRDAVDAGLLGDVTGVHASVDWNHNWIGDTELDDVRHIILYDFGIHWFDVLACLFEDDPASIFASVAESPSQEATPPLLGQAVLQFDDAQASLAFDGDVRYGPQDSIYVAGSAGTAESSGPDLSDQSVTIYTDDGYARPDLETTWFPDGFRGAMGELCRAIEEDREPANSARDNLRTLAWTFAAVASAEDGVPKVPGEVRALR